MAQNTKPDKEKVAQWARRLGLNEDVDQEEIAAHIIRRLKDPTACYYNSNFDIVENSKWISETIEELIANIVPHGFVFRLEDGTFCYPSEHFKSIFLRYYPAFAAKAVRFICTTGYLAWFKLTLPNGIVVPEVCDPRHIAVSYYTDPKTLQSGIRATWRQKEHENIPLYVLSEGLHVGLSSSYRCAPVDRCKEQIAMAVRMDHARIMTLERIANPQIMLTNIDKTRALGGNVHKTSISDGVADELMHYADMLGDDDLAHERVFEAMKSAESRSKANIMRAIDAVPPPVKLYGDLTKDIASNYRHVPMNMEPVDMHRNVKELTDYPVIRKMLRDEIREAFGLARGSDEAPAVDGKNKSSGGGASSAKPITPIMRQWMNSVTYVMTTVFRIIHQPEAIRIGDVKPTYDEEVRKVRFVRGAMVDIAAPNAHKRPVSALAPHSKPVHAKRRKSNFDPAEPAEPAAAEPAAAEDDEDESETEKPKKKGKEEPEAEYKVEEAEEEEDADLIEKNIAPMHMYSNSITVQPLAMILNSRDDAAAFMNQGGITEDRFFELHPPVENGRENEREKKLEKQEQKARDALAKEKEKMEKEAQKERDAIASEKEKLRNDEIKEHKAKIKELESALKSIQQMLESKGNKRD